MAFSVRILDTDGTTVHKHPDLQLEPDRWADMAYGGPDVATIIMDGPQHAIDEALTWLDYEVQILGHDNQAVWWGYLSEVQGGTLHCLGLWHRLDLRYYENLKGREENIEGTAEQDLGLGFTSSMLGAIAYSNIWYEHEAKFVNFESGIKFVVSGSSNDGTYTTTSSSSSDSQTVYTASTIYFEVFDDIRDTASGFNDFRSNEYSYVSGSTRPGNNTWHLLTSVANDHMTTREGVTGNITAESAGASITVSQGSAVDVTSPISSYEIPAANTGISVDAYGEKVVQQIDNNTGAAFTVDRIGIKIRKVGSPTDNITVALYDDSANTPGSLLDSGTISYSDITTQMAWHWADLANTQNFATGTAYWIVITRAASNHHTNFYKVAVDEDLNYSTGDGPMSVRLWDGSGWQFRPTDADLTFRVHGAVETTAQIEAMIDSHGQRLNDVTVFDDSGIETNQYRDGLTLARSEVEALLDQGTSGGDALQTTVTPSGAVIVEQQPDSGTPELMLASSAEAVYSTALDEVFNRVQVLYTYTDSDGQSVSASTDWTVNDDSVDRYGYRELRHSESDLTETTADALRDRILANSAWPALAVDAGNNALEWRHGGPVDAGRLVAGKWLELGNPPGNNSGLMTISPLYIVSSEYDARSGRLTIRPATAPDPWDIGGVTQG